MSARSDWANVGRDFKKLGTDLGKTFVKTVKQGTQKVEDWALNDEKTDAATQQTPVAEAEVVSESQE